MDRDTNIVGTQILVMHKYCEKHHIKVEQYVELDKKYHLHQFIEDNIDYLNGYGLPGILLEIEDYIKVCEEECQ